MFTLTPKIALSALLALTTLSSVQGAPSGQLILQEQPQVLPAYEIPEMMEELKGKKLNINSTVKLNNGIEVSPVRARASLGDRGLIGADGGL